MSPNEAHFSAWCSSIPGDCHLLWAQHGSFGPSSSLIFLWAPGAERILVSQGGNWMKKGPRSLEAGDKSLQGSQCARQCVRGGINPSCWKGPACAGILRANPAQIPHICFGCHRNESPLCIAMNTLNKCSCPGPCDRRAVPLPWCTVSPRLFLEWFGKFGLCGP